jgi:hypothetical protein
MTAYLIIRGDQNPTAMSIARSKIDAAGAEQVLAWAFEPDNPGDLQLATALTADVRSVLGDQAVTLVTVGPFPPKPADAPAAPAASEWQVQRQRDGIAQ